MKQSKLSTGIEKLDRELKGGFLSGSIVNLNVPPESQYEVLLQHFIRERDTLYISTTRSEKRIKKQLENRSIDVQNCGIKYVDPTDSVMENVLDYAKKPPVGSNVIIDIANPLEEEEVGRVINFFHELKTHMEDIDGICIIVSLDTQNDPKCREYTLKMSDVVMNVVMRNQGHENEVVVNVPKYRNGRVISDYLKLEMNDRVEIDTKRQVG